MAKIELTSEDLGLITRALSDSMNYKPNDRWGEKWSLLLTLKQNQLELEQEEKTFLENKQMPSEEEKVIERCPWYETVGRIITILGAFLFLFCFLLSLPMVMILVLDKFTGWNLAEWVVIAVMENPALSIALIIFAFLLFLFWFLSNLVKRMGGSLKES